MKLNQEKKEQLQQKRMKLETAKKDLKNEFFGIHHIIDEVTELIEPWYFFPEHITRPIIINLWGMTGTGKTSLILRLVELLDLKDKFLNFDIGGLTGDRGIYTLAGELIHNYDHLNKKEVIFCFDEFQLGKIG
jgi:ATP-dependent Lon protease